MADPLCELHSTCRFSLENFMAVFMKDGEKGNPAVPVGFCPGLLCEAAPGLNPPPTQWRQLLPGLLPRLELRACCPGV